MQLEILYLTEVLVFYNIVQHFKDFNLQLELIFDQVRNEIKRDYASTMTVIHNDIIHNENDEMKTTTNWTNTENMTDNILTKKQQNEDDVNMSKSLLL